MGLTTINKYLSQQQTSVFGNVAETDAEVPDNKAPLITVELDELQDSSKRPPAHLAMVVTHR